MNDTTTKDVLSVIVAEKLDRATEGLLGAGQRLAESLGGSHRVLTLNTLNPDDQETIKTRCHEIIAVTPSDLGTQTAEARLALTQPICEETKPAAILFGNDISSQELPPRLAHRLGGSSIGDAQTITVQGGRLRVTRSVYGGQAVAIIELQRTPAIIWVRARAMAPAQPHATPAAVNTVQPASLEPAQTKLVSRHEESSEAARLEEATLIVSGGRGLGGAEPFEELKELANVIGAQMAASRAACDSGWAPHSWQVGQTGKKVAPELYLAIALSGSSQHLMGITDAKHIAAINTDPDAPIFKHCRFGIVEDYRNVVGPLKEKLTALLG